MKPSEVQELKLGTPVWVCRFGKGRRWPGMVEGIETANGLPDIKVRIEPFSLARRRTDPPVTVSFVTAPMRRLERRDISVKRSDRPRFVPTSRLRKPEIPAQRRAYVLSKQIRESPAKASARMVLTITRSRRAHMEARRCPTSGWVRTESGVIEHFSGSIAAAKSKRAHRWSVPTKAARAGTQKAERREPVYRYFRRSESRLKAMLWTTNEAIDDSPISARSFVSQRIIGRRLFRSQGRPTCTQNVVHSATSSRGMP